MGRIAVGILVAVAAGRSAPGLAAQSSPGPQRPAYRLLHQDENWQPPAGQAWRGDWADAIKFVPLDDAGRIWLTLGGDLRARLEAWRNFNFAAPPAADHDDVYLLTRARLHADLHFDEVARVFVEGKTAWVTDRDLIGGRRAGDVDSAALQQAFVEVDLPTGDGFDLRLRAGRQMLAFGAQRLVSPLPWLNTMRAWDGGSLHLRAGALTAVGFWTRFAPVQKYSFNDSVDSQLYGVYATWKADESAHGVDVYALGNSEPRATFNGTSGYEQRLTLGVRAFGSFAPVDYEVEAAWQLGEVGSGDVGAHNLTAVLGYTADNELQPRGWVGVDWASGDGSAGGNVGTFNQLYPLGHAFLGYADVVARQNIVDVSAGASVRPLAAVVCEASYHLFWLDDPADALYGVAGQVVRPGGSANTRFVGGELDVTAQWKLDRHTTLLLGYSHFFAGAMVERSGPSADIDFGYASVSVAF